MEFSGNHGLELKVGTTHEYEIDVETLRSIESLFLSNKIWKKVDVLRNIAGPNCLGQYYGSQKEQGGYREQDNTDDLFHGLAFLG